MLATIDVGTNTVRGLLASVEQGRLNPIQHWQQITRLGGGFTPEAGLSSEAIQRTGDALVHMIRDIQQQSPAGLRAVATEAMRKACNAELLVDRVRRDTGVQLEIIPGEEEARLSATGILAGLDPMPTSCVFFDIGGGSTEFGVLLQGELVYFRSFPIGVVRLVEACENTLEQEQQMVIVLQELYEDLLKRDLWSKIISPGLVAVGTAGTATTLAALELEMREYDWRRINNYPLSRSRLLHWQQRLLPLTPADREDLPGMTKGRGDLILPGLNWTLAILSYLRCPMLTVSDFGLLEGALLSIEECR